MKPDVLSLGYFPPGMLKTMEERFTLHAYTVYPLPPGTLSPEIAGRIRGIATEAQRGATRELIGILPKLEVISCFGVGTDAIDLAAARERGISVSNTPGVIADDVADLAIAMMLASARQLLPAERFAREGRWSDTSSYGFTHSITGKRVGIIGLGAIGSAIAARAAPFRVKIAYFDVAPKPGVPYTYVADPVALARDSDFLMVSCFGGPSTRHLVSTPIIDALGAKGTLINVARGTVVDEVALVAALKAGRLGAAALDVFEHEPAIPAELREMPNVILQPHMGTATIETRELMGQMVVDNISAKLAGKPLLTPVV